MAAALTIILLVGCMQGGTAWFDRSPSNGAFARSFLTLNTPRGGAGRYGDEDVDDENDNDYYNSDRHNTHYNPRSRRKQPQKKPLWSRVASQSARLSAKALSATARASSKAAYHLVTPKHVEWRELVGLWRLDEWMNDEDRPFQSTVEFNIRKMVVFKTSTSSAQRTIQLPLRFKPSKWPLSARIEFQNPETELIYSCTVHRKLADKSVLKLRGKIYEKKRWGGSKVLVGTFMGRRRLKLLEDDEDEDDDEDDDDEYVDLDELDDNTEIDSVATIQKQETDDEEEEEERR